MTSRDFADQALDVDVGGSEVLADGFRSYERFQVVVRRPGEEARSQTRDVVRSGRVAAVLPIDLKRNEIVLLRQFRLAAHLATGRGELVEIVAGRVEADESDAAAARRECQEEIGVEPLQLVELFSVISSPGITDEYVTYFVGAVDATRIAARGPDEHEDTRPFAVTIDDALAALAAGTIQNALIVSGLQWLALHRANLASLLQGA